VVKEHNENELYFEVRLTVTVQGTGSEQQTWMEDRVTRALFWDPYVKNSPPLPVERRVQKNKKKLGRDEIRKDVRGAHETWQLPTRQCFS